MTDPAILPLPYPKPPLNWNDRISWQARHRKNKRIRREAATLARHHKIPTGCGFATVRLNYVPKVNRYSDPANWQATSKPVIDGLVDWGLVPDDHQGHLRELPPIIHPASKETRDNQRVWLEIWPEKAGA